MLYTDEDSFEYPLGNASSTGVGGDLVGGANMPQCPHCHRFYETRLKLKAHIQKYCLKEKKYKCMFCIYRSKRRDHIRRHMLKVHATQTNKRLALGLSIEIDESLGEAGDATMDDGVVSMGDHVTGDGELNAVAQAVLAAANAAAVAMKKEVKKERIDNRSEAAAAASGAMAAAVGGQIGAGKLSSSAAAAALAAALAATREGSASGADDDEDDNDYDDGDDDEDDEFADGEV